MTVVIGFLLFIAIFFGVNTAIRFLLARPFARRARRRLTGDNLDVERLRVSWFSYQHMAAVPFRVEAVDPAGHRVTGIAWAGYLPRRVWIEWD